MPDPTDSSDDRSIPDFLRTRTQNPAANFPRSPKQPAHPEDFVEETITTPIAGDQLTVSHNSPAYEKAPTSTQSHEIGRYRIERVIGEGGFAIVYLAYDDQLKRHVAIKVPQPRLIRFPEDADQYLIEAQVVASLEHPAIVPVYDVGRTADGLPYIVARYIEGCNLSERLRQSRLSVRDSVSLVIRIAEALAYAHDHRLVHRDVKPGNILMEEGTKPFLVDFGLALREEDLGKGSGAGTPAYMSPEQANGEGHLVDGRSDIYSLGVILYELLTGIRPHAAKSIRELFIQIIEAEPKPPRHLDESIPAELERIVLKSLAKRASDRYATAHEFADDLRFWLSAETEGSKKEEAKVAIVPKGLRSFDSGDTEFFLELLPGPRDRSGLPDSLRFWKKLIEETDPAKTFRVGVIYGPSGCGKSSFVKAGLLPRLSENVHVVYIEATSDETEARLLRGLERVCPDLPEGGNLKDAMIYLRRREDIERKVVLIIDQFEQWLYSSQNREGASLVNDLRHCDGEHIQCIVMVRDDFWMPLSRFMDRLEVRIIGGQNAAAIDLFDPAHARNVLSAFGRAYGTLPSSGMLNPEQLEFIDQAVSGLAQNKKVISVRLSLFAEMMKGREWTPASLADVGGTEGIGVTFLEETFSSSSAPPEHRHHQEAARAVLRALLPGSGTDIKGHKRSHSTLLTASGYEDRPAEFERLIGMLDNELRLITPTDNEAIDSVRESERHYQLTHDFLVPSLREWLTRKQKETKLGRTELMLEDLADVWHARRENRQLPSLIQWIRIKRLIPRKNWSTSQTQMMASANRYHGWRLSLFVMFTMMMGATVVATQHRNNNEQRRKKANELVERLAVTEISRVPEVIREMEPYRESALPLLKERMSNATGGSSAKLHYALAMATDTREALNFLFDRMLHAEPSELSVIRDALHPSREQLKKRLWDFLENPKSNRDEKLRAAAALAQYSPDDPNWKTIAEPVAAILVVQKIYDQLPWGKALQDAGPWLIEPLERILFDEKRGLAERGHIANLWGIYAAKNPAAFGRLESMLERTVGLNEDPEWQFAIQKQQASAAMVLLINHQDSKVWPMLRHAPDPTVRTLMIDRMAAFGVESRTLTDRLDRETDVSIVRALIQALGEYGLDQMTAQERSELVPKIIEIYQNNRDSGVHGSAEYLVRKWGMTRDLTRVELQLQIGSPVKDPNWFINDQGQTMSIIRTPGEFWMGEDLQTHRRRIDRDFAIATKEVTVEQFQRFLKERRVKPFALDKEASPTFDSPISAVSWFEAAEYCNWLSEKDGIPPEQWCYVPNRYGQYASGMWMKKNFLNLSGYRLPTESEWEFACRSGSASVFSFGNSPMLLDKYGWYDITTRTAKSFPVGSLRPNDFGLFDMHGNMWEWCQDAYTVLYPLSWKGTPLMDRQNENRGVGTSGESRVLRGGSFKYLASDTRSAYRGNILPSNNYNDYGFRVAKTIKSEK